MEPQPPLPPPEKFTDKHFTGTKVEQVSVGKHEGHVAVVLTGPGGYSLLFRTSPAGARQLAASILNQADEIDEDDSAIFPPW